MDQVRLAQDDVKSLIFTTTTVIVIIVKEVSQFRSKRETAGS